MGKTPEARHREYLVRRQRFMDANLCLSCGQANDRPGTERCTSCLRRKNKSRIARRLARQSTGLCLCGKPIEAGKECNNCKAIGRAEAQTKRDRNKELGVCPNCGGDISDTIYCKECSKRATISTVSKHRERRRTVLDHYGRECVCCHTTILEFLTIDHVNNDGTLHRREIGRGVNGICWWAIKNNFPNTLQVMCTNCNCGKGKFGNCPHKIQPQLTSLRLERKAVIDHYGGKCTCCGESNWAFLEFDHINNNGAEHKRSLNTCFSAKWIRRNNFPDTIQLHCSNCNLGRWLCGVCPHKRTDSGIVLGSSAIV